MWLIILIKNLADTSEQWFDARKFYAAKIVDEHGAKMQ